jgi:hypothetical protein
MWIEINRKIFDYTYEEPVSKKCARKERGDCVHGVRKRRRRYMLASGIFDNRVTGIHKKPPEILRK